MTMLKEKVVIITGASSGIGKAVAVEFAKHGSRLVLTGRNEADLQDTVDKCKHEGITDSQILSLIVDFAGEEEGIKNLVDKTIEKFGVIDILVNNAGTSRRGNLETQTMEDYDLTMKVNVRSVFYLTKLVRPHIIKQKGNIIMMSSINSIIATRNDIAYNMSKAALDHLMRNLAIELAEFGVRVNSVNPGAVPTKIQRRAGMTEEEFEKYMQEIGPAVHALKRYGETEEVAKAVRFLASDEASFTTGMALTVDGGAIISYAGRLAWSVISAHTQTGWRISRPSADTMATSLKDKVALITGASNGIGKAIAVEFARHGSKLVLTGRNEADLQDTVDQCKHEGVADSQILSVIVDFAGEDEGIKNLVDKTIEKFEVIDILVNNAGTAKFGNLETQTMEDYDLIMKVNLRSVFYLTKLVRPHIIKQKGNIVMVSSVNSLIVTAKTIAYNMSKAALDHLMRNLAIELAEFGVRVNAVNPGEVLTKLQGRVGIAEDQLEKYAEEVGPTVHALGRCGEREEVARAVRFLASDDASFTTGVTLPVDGGAAHKK
ncbi:putative short-chain type dehydrogenase/reductase y4vI [Tubulanus polymorphus]|uniref:putative short-chain type dehydrogenase/reductase y4vI n=1 Tax=Tubulanus polymorphus TaxID=672921 RepID=UPI003DA1FB3D